MQIWFHTSMIIMIFTLTLQISRCIKIFPYFVYLNMHIAHKTLRKLQHTGIKKYMQNTLQEKYF